MLGPFAWNYSIQVLKINIQNHFIRTHGSSKIHIALVEASPDLDRMDFIVKPSDGDVHRERYVLLVTLSNEKL